MSELMVLPEHVRPQRRIRGLYAALPGSGPAGEKCGGCKNFVRFSTYSKCDLCRAQWTGGLATDALARTPACKYWEAAETGTKEGRRAVSWAGAGGRP